MVARGTPARLLFSAFLALPWAVPGQGDPTAGQADPTAAIHGVVVDAETGAPVVGAEVVVSGGPSTLTGENGAWRLEDVSAGERLVHVSHIGYGAERVEVRVPTDAPVRVVLEPRAIPLDAVVVTGSRREQRLADVPVTTELVGRAEVERSGASDLAAVLTEQTGIQLQGGHPVGAGVMLQGLDSERVLVLVDGQPYVGRLSGTVDLSRIPAAMVERVEVVKGPQSTLYGSEAMGGVVNVITRRARGDWRGTLGGTLGTDGRLDGHVEAGGRVGGVDLLANVGRRHLELMPGQSSASGARSIRWDGLGKARWSWREGASVSATLMLQDEAQRWRAGPLYQFADNRQWSARVGAEWLGRRWRLAPAIYAASFDHLARQSNGMEPPPGSAGDRQIQSLWEGELVYGYTGRVVDVDAGVEVAHERLESESLTGRSRERTGVEPFIQLPARFGSVTVVPGLRASWHEEWGGHLTPRLATMWRPVPSLAVRASLGRGYRAPGFKELYMDFLNIGPGYGYVVRGNDALVPETSTNVTAGLEWAGERLFARGQVFHNRFDDFIESHAVDDSAGVTIYTYDNVAEGVTEGLEAEAGVRLAGFRLEGGYAWLRTEDRSTGASLLGRPTHSARLTASQRLPAGLSASLAGTFTGETPLARDQAGTTTRDAYLRFDLRVAAEFLSGVRVSAGVDNLLDEVPGHWPGYAGRQLYLTATIETDALR